MVFSCIVAKPLRRLGRVFSVTVIALTIGAFGAMAAEVEVVELPPEVTMVFRGQLVDLFEMPPVSLPVKDLIAKIKKQRRMEFGAQLDRDPARWAMQFLAFPTRRPVGQVSIEFWEIGTERRWLASHDISEPFPAAACVRLVVNMDEDDGLVKGRTYSVELVERKDTQSIGLARIAPMLLK
jgi:hypothetical protein